MKALLGWIISLIAAVLFLMPLLWMVHATFRPDDQIFQTNITDIFTGGELTLSNYADACRRGDVGQGLINSFLQVGGIVLIGLVVNSMAAYAFARLEFPGRNVLFAGVVVLIVLPVEALAVPLLITVRDLHMTGGYARTILALVIPFSAKAFNIYFLRQHFLSLPQEMEEAAVVDGAGPFAVFWRVALPTVRPALATVVVLDVLTHWGQLLWPLMVCTREETRTIQLSLANLLTQPPIQWGDIMACAVIATLPVILLFTYCQRHLVATHLGAGIK